MLEFNLARKKKAVKLFHVLDKHMDKMAQTMGRIRTLFEEVEGDISADNPCHCSESDTDFDVKGNPVTADGKHKRSEKTPSDTTCNLCKELV